MKAQWTAIAVLLCLVALGHAQSLVSFPVAVGETKTIEMVVNAGDSQAQDRYTTEWPAGAKYIDYWWTTNCTSASLRYDRHCSATPPASTAAFTGTGCFAGSSSSDQVERQKSVFSGSSASTTCSGNPCGPTNPLTIGWYLSRSGTTSTCTMSLSVRVSSECNGNGNEVTISSSSYCTCNGPNFAGERCSRTTTSLAALQTHVRNDTLPESQSSEGFLNRGMYYSIPAGMPSGEPVHTTVTVRQRPGDASTCVNNIDVYGRYSCGTTYNDVDATNSLCVNRFRASSSTGFDSSTSSSVNPKVLTDDSFNTKSSCKCSITSTSKSDVANLRYDIVVVSSSQPACDYQLEVTQVKECNDHGTYDVTAGRCRCNSPWAGPRCDQQVVTLANPGASGATTYNGTMGTNAYHYLTFRVGGRSAKLPRVVVKPQTAGDTCVASMDVYLKQFCGNDYTDTQTDSLCMNRWSPDSTAASSGTVDSDTGSNNPKEVTSRTFKTMTYCGCDISSSSTTYTERYFDVGRIHYDVVLKTTTTACAYSLSLTVGDECNYNGVPTVNATTSGSDRTADSKCQCDSSASGQFCNLPLTQLQPGVVSQLTASYTEDANGQLVDRSHLLMYVDTVPGNFDIKVTSREASGVGSNCLSTSTQRIAKFYYDCDDTCGTNTLNVAREAQSKSVYLRNTFSSSTTFNTQFPTTSTDTILACGCNKTASAIKKMRLYIDFRASATSSVSPGFFCVADIQVDMPSPCTPADCFGNGTCATGGVCQCKDGFEGISCIKQRNTTAGIQEVYNAANEYSFKSSTGEPTPMWIQISKSNSIASVRVEPGSYSSFTTGFGQSSSGDAVIMAKWKAMPDYEMTVAPYFGDYNLVDFSCKDCDFVIRKPLVDNATLSLDPSSMEETNQGIYVVVGITGGYRSNEQYRTANTNSLRSFKVKVSIEDPNGVVVIVVLILLVLAFVAYIYVGVRYQKYNPKEHAQKVSEVFNAGFEKLEKKMVSDMRGSEAKEAEEEEEEEEGEEGEEKDEENPVDEAKEEAKEAAKEKAAEAKAAASSAAKSAGSAAKHAVTDPMQIVVIVLSNCVGLFFGLIKTLFNVSLLFSNFSKFTPLDITFYRFQMSLAVGGLADLLIGFTAIFSGIDIVGGVGLSWNCGGAGVVLAPFILLLGAFFLRVLLKRDFLLLSTMWLNSFKKRQPEGKRRAFVSGLVNLGNAFIFYTVQVIVLTVGAITGNLTGGRNCGDLDLVVRGLGVTVVAIMLLIFFVMHFHLFAGTDPKLTNLSDEEKKNIGKGGWAAAALFFVRGLGRLLLLLLGIWTNGQVKAYRITERAAKYDDDEEDDDSQQETVIASVGKASGLIWLLFPFTIVATKLTEALNNPPLFDLTKDDAENDSVKLDLITNTRERAVAYVSNFLNMLGVVVFVASAAPAGLVIAMLALLPNFGLNLYQELRGDPL